jgi:hypothetical protein
MVCDGGGGQEVRRSYLPTLLDAEWSHECLRDGTHCSSPESISDQTS